MSNDTTLRRLLEQLSDGEWHSGEDLGAHLAVSRAAISKKIKHLVDMGIELEAVKGVGYRTDAFELLDDAAIRSEMTSAQQALLSELHLRDSIPSTNQFLLDTFQQSGDIHGQVCLAERQTSGRGRRGRQWFSPFAKNLYLSLGWNFEGGVAEIEGLSLAVGAVVCQVLESAGFSGASLKWPNDILLEGKKLGGVLIELGGDATSNCVVVVGIGLNVDMRAADESVDQPWSSLSQAGFECSRNRLAAALTSGLLDMLAHYPQRGFPFYREDWNRRSAFTGKQVNLMTAQDTTEGTMLGVGDQGQLLIEVSGEERSFIGGELSVRLQV